jgi:hypothetical protein
MGTEYCNLDQGLINYYFEHEFSSRVYTKQQVGYTLNHKEDVSLENGNFICKETFLESSSISHIEKEELTNLNVSLNKIRFQIDGSNAIHYFALSDSLSIVLDTFENSKPEYLYGILMKNKYNLTPLDITIKNERPKNTELLLNYLLPLEDVALS